LECTSTRPTVAEYMNYYEYASITSWCSTYLIGVTQSCSSSFGLLFSQLFLQDGCAETALLSGNVQWFQDNACRLCPCNGTIFIFAFDCIIFCSWGKIFLELSMLTSNADEWNHISEKGPLWVQFFPFHLFASVYGISWCVLSELFHGNFCAIAIFVLS
jgi:hypothetical protein